MIAKIGRLRKYPRKLITKFEDMMLIKSREAITFKPRSIQMYNRILDDYWNPLYRAKRFHLFTKLRIQLIYGCSITDFTVDNAHAKPEFRDTKLLVVGCGGGILTEALAEMNFDVTGIDPNPNFILTAKDHQKRNKLLSAKKLCYFQTTVEKFAQDYPYQFDGVIVSEVLEYISSRYKRAFLERCVKLCKPGGNLFVTHINRNFKTFKLSMLFNLEPNFNAIPLPWFRGISPDALSTILKNCKQSISLCTGGCTIRRVQGISYDLYKIEFIHETNTTQWYFMHATKNLLS